MSESIAVRCPACGRGHRCTAPPYPCACGAPVAPRLDPGGTATPVTRRVWDEEWIAVVCAACGARGEWPRPELGCACGVTLRLPLWRAADGRTVRPAPPAGAALDAVTAVVRHLHRLGHRRIRRAGRPPGPGIALAGPGLVVRLDPADLPVPVRDVECLWLTAMAQGAECVHYSLAGYTAEALARAGALGVPLFALDPPGTPRPVNDHAAALADGPDA